MKELSDTQLEMANDILSLIYRNEGEIRKSSLDKYIQRIYEKRYKNYLQFNMKYQSLLKASLIEEYKLVYLNNANIGVTRLGKKVAADVKGIKGFIDKLDEDESEQKLATRTGTVNNIVATVLSISGIIVYVVGLAKDDQVIKYILISIGSFLFGILLSDPIKKLIRQLLKGNK